MTNNKLIVYDNQGNLKYPSDIKEDKKNNLSIKSAWSAKRRFIATNDGEENIIQCFAIMHTGRHEEQLYIEFRYQNDQNVFDQFSEAVTNQLIHEQGWKLLNHKTNRYIHAIMNFDGSDTSNLPLSKIEILLDEDQDVKTFTSDPSQAILLASEILTRGYDVTIADKADSFKYCDVGIHVATKYQRKIRISQENEEYYRKQQEKIKRKELKESLKNSVKNIKSEMGQDTFVSMLEDVLSDSRYGLKLSNPESESETTDHSPKQGENTKFGGYSTISYGLNAITGIILLLYIASKALEFRGSSFADQIGLPFEITAVFLTAFLLGYGSLGALWVLSDISEQEIGVLGLVSAGLSGGIYYLIGVGPLRNSFPTVIGGLSWWITLSVVPVFVALVRVTTSELELLESETESKESFDIQFSVAVLAGIGILGGFLLGDYGLQMLSTYLGESIALVGLVIVLSVGLIVFVAYLWKLGKYQEQISQVAITIFTFSVGLGISGSLIRYNFAPQLQQPIIKIVVAIPLSLVVYRITDYTSNHTSIFDGGDKLSIVAPKSEDGDPPIVQGPKFTVEVSNKLDEEWVTLELNSNNQTVDHREIHSEVDASQDKLTCNLRTDETGKHKILAHTGKGTYSGHEGGRDGLEVTVSSIEESSPPKSDYHPEQQQTQGSSADTDVNSGGEFDNQPQEMDSGSWEFESNIEESESGPGTDDSQLEQSPEESKTDDKDDFESDDGWPDI